MESLAALTKALVSGFQGPGGWSMWVILIVGMLGVAITVERVFYLFVKCGLSRGRFMEDLFKILKTGDTPRAIKFAGASDMPIAKVMVSILGNKDKGADAMNKSVDEVFLTENPKILRYTPQIVMVANVATLLGLLGTIYGLILAFDAVANVPAAQRAQALATGISVAMATTFFGLIIGIPLMFIHGVLSAQTDRILEEMDEKSAKLVNILSEQA
jgi:biopolymer transport protein ExbB/TolQ